MEILDAIDSTLEPMAASIGFPLDQIKYVICMMLSIPVGFMWSALPSATVKHIAGIITGIAFLVFCLGPTAWLHSLVSSLVAYLLVTILPSSISHKAVFLFAFVYLSTAHIYRMATDYMGWTLDFTGAQMVITLKLVSFAFNLHDAKVVPLVPTMTTEERRDPKLGAKKMTQIETVEKLNKDRAAFALKYKPDLLAFLGYIYFPVTLLAGPVCEFVEYRSAADGTMFDRCPNKRVPSRFLPVLKVFAQSLIMMGLVTCAGLFPLSKLRTEEFLHDWSQLHKWGFLYVSMTLIRCRYYFGWMLAEAACIASGIGFNGFGEGGKLLWDRMQNVSVLLVELPENGRSVSIGWNSRVALWLRRYVYLRVGGKPGQPNWVSTLAAFAVSAFWHGFYPGYYIAFVSGTLFVEAAKALRRDLGPIFAPGARFAALAPLYSVASTVAALWVFTYICGAFQLLDFMDSLRLMKSLYFVPHFASVAAIVLLSMLRSTLQRWYPPVKK
eukprot:TRINITY_DN14253_c0_g1_i1.p1 TRINITY_DN14253_c0_g1~~TRINITY_DN14253_c0_g1_i1.p1  ORF type:complete len:516 (+),score=113.30 TRINITY_DN14253_c0_g1_i1:60-1550(+)